MFTLVQVSQVVAELLPQLEDVLFAGHSGVVVKMAEAALRSPAQQQEVVQTLLTVFHTDTDTSACLPLFLTLTAYEVYSEHRKKMESDKDLERVCKKPILLVYSFIVLHVEKHTCARVSAGSSIGQIQQYTSDCEEFTQYGC